MCAASQFGAALFHAVCHPQETINQKFGKATNAFNGNEHTEKQKFPERGICQREELRTSLVCFGVMLALLRQEFSQRSATFLTLFFWFGAGLALGPVV